MILVVVVSILLCSLASAVVLVAARTLHPYVFNLFHGPHRPLLIGPYLVSVSLSLSPPSLSCCGV